MTTEQEVTETVEQTAVEDTTTTPDDKFDPERVLNDMELTENVFVAAATYLSALPEGKLAEMEALVEELWNATGAVFSKYSMSNREHDRACVALLAAQLLQSHEAIQAAQRAIMVAEFSALLGLDTI